jgi:hypothetical protein
MRKGWDAITDEYKRRLTRAGIDRSAYESGASLSQARGHTSTQWESWKRHEKKVDQFVKEYQRIYDYSSTDTYTRPDFEQLRQTLKGMSPSKADKIMREQRKMQEYYDKGEIRKARRIWDHRDRSLPDYMFYYHGAFN